MGCATGCIGLIGFNAVHCGQESHIRVRSCDILVQKYFSFALWIVLRVSA